jgi:alkylation response protein AidB-like acyl-CoA dehydrogenase
VEAVDSIDPTRPAGRVSAPDEAGDALSGDVARAVDRALVAVSSELVGVCGRALSMTVAYVKDRKQFGVPIGSYQAVSHRCAQMLLDTERARSITAFAAWAADADPTRLGEAAAMAKAAASDAGVEVTTSAIQAHGGIGFTWEADVHWLYKRALLDASLLGGAKRQRARLAPLLA